MGTIVDLKKALVAEGICNACKRCHNQATQANRRARRDDT